MLVRAYPAEGEEVSQICFTTYCRAEPQGSMRGFVLPGKGAAKPRAILTSNNPKMRPYRQELTHSAMAEMRERGLVAPLAAKHVPVGVVFDFYFARPASIPKKRTRIVVKPDLDKVIRATADSLTGILYADDAQIVEMVANKHYGIPERVEISVCTLD